MNAQDLRKLLEQSEDKMNIFKDAETIFQYDLKVVEFLNIITDFLTDEEKKELVNCPFFENLSKYVQYRIIELISDDNIKLQFLKNSDNTDNISIYDVIDVIKTLSSNSIKQLLYDPNFMETYNFSEYQLKDIILRLDDKTKEEVLFDKSLIIERFKLSELSIEDIIKSLTTDEAKKRMLNNIKLSEYAQVRIITAMNNDEKIQMILGENEFNKYQIIDILKSLDVVALCEFLKNNKTFCSENDIHPYEIVMKLEDEKQKEFVARLEDIDLDIEQKREILVTLAENVKQSLDTTNWPQEYKTAIAMNIKKKILVELEVDLNANLEDYRGLDNLIRVCPEEFTEDERKKFMQLCTICPELKVISRFNEYLTIASTTSDYIEAEKWITELISSLKPEYSNAQKIAIIDNAIGKKISYSPDFETEVFDKDDSRALWKIIASGYGVCNGIAKVEQYILKRVGIESEIISGEKHAFLKIQDLEMPLANGKVARGNTILDPTWNLCSHRFGGFPHLFCISYDEARKSDIDINGNDHKCHENVEKLSDATLNVDEQSLRMLFASVGLADRNGEFPLKALVEESRKIDEECANEPYRNICEQFKLLKRACPEFAMCQNSSMDILNLVIFKNKNLTFNNSIINRVYDKTDESKSPILFVYIDSDAFGKKGFLADKTKGEFVEITEEEFKERYACYEEDLNKDPDLMPWQREGQKENLQDTNTITSPIPQIAEKGGEER